MKKLRQALVTCEILGNQSGVAYYVHDLLEFLAELGYEVTVIGAWCPECLKLPAKKVIKLPSWGAKNNRCIFPPLIWRGVSNILAWWIGRQLAQLDLVIANGPYVSAVIANKVAERARRKGLKVRQGLVLHSMGEDYVKIWFRRWPLFISWLIQKTWYIVQMLVCLLCYRNRTFALSTAIKNTVPAFVGVRLVETGISPLRPSGKTKAQIRKDWQIPESAIPLGYIGRVNDEKSVSRLLRAFVLAAVENPHLLLYLIGPGDLQRFRGEAKRLCEENGLAINRISFLGPFERDDLGEPHELFELIVSGSHTENASRGLMEAMLARKAIVFLNAGGNAQILGPAGRFLSPYFANNEEETIRAFKERLLYCIDPQRSTEVEEVAQIGYEFAAAHYSFRRHFRDLIDACN